MNLNELKKMIAEEYHNYLAEQPADPQIDVDADDIGGEDAEATLKDIFDILKGYFEGGDTDMGADMGADMAGGEMDDDLGDEEIGADEEEDEEEEEEVTEKKELQERFKRLANIIKG